MGTVFAEGSITGHASPKWKNPGKKDKKILNKELSIRRAREVETFLQAILERKFHENGVDIEFALECTKERDFNSISIPAQGIGDSITFEEGGGDPNANTERMRRTDINVVLTHQIEGEAGMSVLVEIPEECEDQATTDWAIRINMSGGAGHAGVGGAFALGEIKNRKTNQKAQGSFVGGGLGFGLQTPGADPGWSDWTNFRTDQKITFDHFDGTLTRLTTAGAGFLIGYTLAYISFPIYGANSISVGGLNLGSVGADAGTNVGQWNFSADTPRPRCIPTHEIAEEQFVPYTYEVQDALRHSVFFDTGEHHISDDELSKMENFADSIADQLLQAT